MRTFLPWKIVFFSFSLVLVATGFAVREGGYSVITHSHERGRIVLATLRKQVQKVCELPISLEAISLARNWPDDFLQLEIWLIQKAFRNESPNQIMDQLQSLMYAHSFSGKMSTSLMRWEGTLSQWAQAQNHNSFPSLDELYEEASRKYFEAVGYAQVGRSYDATPLFLWAIKDAMAFVERSVLDPRVPEVLFIFGNAFYRLKHALPEPRDAEKFLRICGDLFPESLWSLQALELKVGVQRVADHDI